MRKPLLLLAVIMLLGACASSTPEATPIPASTNTPKPLAAPTPSAQTETIFIEPIRKQIYSELADVQDKGIGDEEAYNEIAKQWGITMSDLRAIALEGIEKGWLPTPNRKPPTATPMPPALIPPSPTAVPDWVAEIAYTLLISTFSQQYSETFSQLGPLLIEAGSNPLLLLDADWKISVAAHLEALQLTGWAVQNMDVPDRFQDIHRDFTQAIEHFDIFGQLLAEGIDEVDMDKLDRATTEILAGTALIDAAAAKINALQP